MRLSKIKLNGFKSFAENTTITLPSQLVGVVGPNGCGKSNVMDALRWVLGESKASELRGDSMQDVIFNGTTSRKAMDKASVELIFDNFTQENIQQLNLAVQSALNDNSNDFKHKTLSVKRTLTRKGQSDYFINDEKVRRKDITDLFLGTGLGAGSSKSYAIIGQGMVAKIIEAKPDELRIYVEEAAGISRYKERRKETQIRLEDSNDHLLRLTDLQNTLNSQVQKLQQQAATAQKYNELSAEIEKHQKSLLWLQIFNAEKSLQKQQSQSQDLQQELQNLHQNISQNDLQINNLKQQQNQANQQILQEQEKFYVLQTKIAEQQNDLKHQIQQSQQIAVKFDELSQKKSQLLQQISNQQNELQRWQDLEQIAHQRLKSSYEILQQIRSQEPNAEKSLYICNQQANQIRKQISEFSRNYELANSDKTHAQRNLQQLTQRKNNLNLQIQQIQQQQQKLQNDKNSAISLENLEKNIQNYSQQISQIQAEISKKNSQNLVENQHLQDLQQQFNNLQTELITTQTKLQSQQELLKNYQQQLEKFSKNTNANQQKSAEFENILQQHCVDFTPLWQKISIQKGYENLIQQVLQDKLFALNVNEDFFENIKNLKNTSFFHENSNVFYGNCSANNDFANSANSANSANNQIPNFESLFAKITLKNHDQNLAAFLKSQLGNIFCCQNISEALENLHLLPNDNSHFITQNGDLIFANFIHFHKNNANQNNQNNQNFRLNEVIELQNNIKNIEKNIENLQKNIDQILLQKTESETQINSQKNYLTAIKQQISALQNDLTTNQQNLQNAKLQLVKSQQIANQQAQQQQTLENFYKQANDLQNDEQQEITFLQNATAKIQQIEQQIALQKQLLQKTQSELNVAENQVKQLRQQKNLALQEHSQAEFSLKESQQRYKNFQEKIKQNQQNLEQNQQEFQQHLDLQQQICQNILEAENQIAQINQCIENQQQQLNLAKISAEKISQNLVENEQQQAKLNELLLPLNEKITENLLKIQNYQQLIANYQQQLQEINAELPLQASAEILAEFEANPQFYKVSVLQNEIATLKKALNKLGAVNLAALQELSEQNQQKSELDAQVADLQQAVERLQNAIKQIDQETKNLLKRTFWQINSKFNELFPDLFGGGKAELTWLGEDILSAGLQVIAQPPGKKNSTIQLLSGGEKALTAIALIFSFFALNPAPFCLLDEVDAPLDDPNTERFCQLVKKMSEQTQFLFISHNRIAMAAAEQLIGVTMQERGISRIVAVDVNQAMEMENE